MSEPQSGDLSYPAIDNVTCLLDQWTDALSAITGDVTAVTTINRNQPSSTEAPQSSDTTDLQVTTTTATTEVEDSAVVETSTISSTSTEESVSTSTANVDKQESSAVPADDDNADDKEDEDTTHDESEPSGSEPNTVLIGGAIGGSLSGVVLGAAVVWFLLRYRAKNKQQPRMFELAGDPPMPGSGFGSMRHDNLKPGGQVTWNQYPPGGLSSKAYSPGGYSPGGYSPGGYSSGGYSPGGYSSEDYSPGGHTLNDGYSSNGYLQGKAQQHKDNSQTDRHWGVPELGTHQPRSEMPG